MQCEPSKRERTSSDTLAQFAQCAVNPIFPLQKISFSKTPEESEKTEAEKRTHTQTQRRKERESLRAFSLLPSRAGSFRSSPSDERYCECEIRSRLVNSPLTGLTNRPGARRLAQIPLENAAARESAGKCTFTARKPLESVGKYPGQAFLNRLRGTQNYAMLHPIQS